MLGIKANKNIRGDTIIEILIAIAIAAFAIGTSYAIANNSLQKAISARERNEAINILERQITALKLRYKQYPDLFRSDDRTKGFIVPSGVVPTSFPFTDDVAGHFCLNEAPSTPQDPTWARITNNFDATHTPDDLNVGNPGYTLGCLTGFGGVAYYIDVSTQITSHSKDLDPKYRTVYKFMVRWPQAGGGMGSSTIYYRL